MDGFMCVSEDAEALKLADEDEYHGHRHHIVAAELVEALALEAVAFQADLVCDLVHTVFHADEDGHEQCRQRHHDAFAPQIHEVQPAVAQRLYHAVGAQAVGSYDCSQSHDDDGNEKVVEISLYEYMGEVNDSMGYDLYAAITNKEITEGKYIPTSDVLPKEVVWANEEQKKYCEDLIDGIDIDFASAFIVGTSPTEDGARVGIAKSQANEILKILKKTELVISEPTNPNMPAVTEIHIAMHTGEYIKIVWDTSYFTVYEKGAEAAYRFDASKMTESFVKFSNCHNEMFLNGLGTLAQYPD